MNLTPHFTLEEFTYSQTAARLGLDNSPTPEILRNLERVALVMEDVRARLGHPIRVTSGYRSPELNKSVPGSSNTSMHTQGLAVDFICPGFGNPLKVCNEISQMNIPFDQLIHEFGQWVHLGLSIGEPRRQLLTASVVNGKTVYEIGLK